MALITDLPDAILEEIFSAMRDLLRFPGDEPYNVRPRATIYPFLRDGLNVPHV